MTRRGENAGNHGRGMNWIRLEKRWRIYERDGWRCVWCRAEVGSSSKASPVGLAGRRLATLDHVLPRANGGTNHESNLVTSCTDCNERRGNRSAIEFAFEGAAYDDGYRAAATLDRVLEAMGRALPPARKAAA